MFYLALPYCKGVPSRNNKHRRPYEWRCFQESIERAKTACEASGLDIGDHFADIGKMKACKRMERKMSEKEWPNSVSNPQISGQMYCICIENELDLYKNEVIHMANAVLQTRIDKATKDEAEHLFESLGLDITTAIRLFLKQAINQRCIPFDIVPPQREFSESTLAAIEEAKSLARSSRAKRYSSAKELLEDCK